MRIINYYGNTTEELLREYYRILLSITEEENAKQQKRRERERESKRPRPRNPKKYLGPRMLGPLLRFYSNANIFQSVKGYWFTSGPG